MPSLARSSSWFVRVTAPHAETRHNINLIAQWIDIKRCLCILHIGEKTEKEHCHFVIELSSQLQKQAFDVRVKKIFEVKGSNYSSKVWDGDDNAAAYMFHEENAPIILQKGFIDDDIQRFRSINQSVQKVMAINNERSSKRIVDKIIEDFSTQGEGVTIELIYISVMRYIRAGVFYHPGDFAIKKYCQEAYMKICDEKDFDNYVTRSYRDLFRDV